MNKLLSFLALLFLISACASENPVAPPSLPDEPEEGLTGVKVTGYNTYLPKTLRILKDIRKP